MYIDVFKFMDDFCHATASKLPNPYAHYPTTAMLIQNSFSTFVRVVKSRTGSTAIAKCFLRRTEYPESEDSRSRVKRLV